jgi:hypothetical protein
MFAALALAHSTAPHGDAMSFVRVRASPACTSHKPAARVSRAHRAAMRHATW